MVCRGPRVQPIPPAEVKKIKVCLIGDSQAGKSAFAKVFAEQPFPDSYISTVGSDFFMRNLETTGGNYQFNLWDLSGDSVYSEVRNEFFKESQVILLMYDITKKRSFENLNNWMGEASRADGGANLPVYVIGCKSDLNERRAVPQQDAERWTKQKNYVGYYETSAKDNNGFLRIFREMADNTP